MLKSLALLGTLAVANADMYMQGMRGSNNRLDEANRDRTNGNRLFDSQNNNRGGYNVGSMYYYDGSQVPIEWTNQHSCGNENNHCEIVMQYMCDPLIRDGTTTSTIPTDNDDCANGNCDTDVEYGRQESWEWYYQCRDRQRNMGLFTANQDLRGDAAIYTRQNPTGNRRGYECPEERDYYPYWSPSPWKDIAVYTNEASRCAAYKEESQNVKSRWSCQAPEGLIWYHRSRGSRGWLPINGTECEELSWYDEAANVTEWAQWVETPSHGLDAPFCGQSAWSRDNHHGNGVGGFMLNYNWTVPSEFVSEQCIFRLRYNISTMDFEGFESATSVGPNAADNDPAYNVYDGDANDDPSYIPIWENFFLDYSDVEDSFDSDINDDDDQLTNSREYVLKNDPNVDIFGGLLIGESQGLLKLQVALNTAQFGRTFQDRSHTFAVRKRPAELRGRTIVNVQVRGKRGNIVQTYPGVEYDFQPNRVHITNSDFVHFQWTGSNTNPNNNAGQGKAGTDRSNVVVLSQPKYAEGQHDTNTYGQWGLNYPGTVDDEFLGLRRIDKEHLAVLSNMQYGGEMSELDDAGTYFDLGPRQVTKQGIYHYVSTRNNNFSNRSQKGKIVVGSESVYTQQVGSEGARLEAGNVVVTVPANSLTSAQTLTVTRMSTSDSDHLSEIVSIAPTQWEGGQVWVAVPFDSYHSPKLSHSASGDANGAWEGVDDVDYDNNVATAEIGMGGLYVVTKGSPINVAAAVLVPIFLIAFIVVFYMAYHKRNNGDYGVFQRLFAPDTATTGV